LDRARAALLLGGAALFIGLLYRIGPAAVMNALVGLSWRLPLVVLFPACVVTTFDALGWRFAFRRDRVRFRTLLAARLAGEAFNLTTPTASVGGEAVKAWLVRPYVALAESLPSVIVAKTTHTMAQVVFLLVGLIVARLTLDRSSIVLLAMQWLLVTEILAVGGFVVVQVLGPIGATGRLLGRLRLLAGRAGALEQMDHDLGDYYRHAPCRLALSVGCHFGGWALGILETYIMLHALTVPVSLAEATVIEAFGSGVGFAAFLIPGRLGAMEAGNLVVFATLGLSSTSAFALALVQRLRETTWAGIGLLALSFMRASAPVPAPPSPAVVEEDSSSPRRFV
jgi:hypothetical protein